MFFVLCPKVSTHNKQGKRMIRKSSFVKLDLPEKKLEFSLYCKENNLEEPVKSSEGEKNIFFFFKETVTEMSMIEWPSLDRLFKQFVIVVISLVFSAIFIYSVDGIFASLSRFLFEGN